MRVRRLIQISEEYLEKILAEVRGKLTEGLSKAAEKLISATLENYSHTPNNQAKLYQLLSYTLETQGQYKESLQIIEKYDDEELLDKLDLEHRLLVIIQLAISLNNTNEHPKAVALLNYALEEAEAENLTQFYGEIYIALARVYRKLNEYPIARDHAEKALNYYRTEGDWHRMSPEIVRNAKSLSPQDLSGNVKPITSYNSTFATFNTGSHIGTLEDAVSELETQLIKEALTRHEWNISRASRRTRRNKTRTLYENRPLRH